MGALALNKRGLTQVLGIVALFIAPLFSGCEGFNTHQSTATTCATGTAQIFVYDGQVQRVCGCTEGTGTSSSVNCTVSAGTRIYFHFINIQIQHQIAVTGIGSTRLVSPNFSTTDQVDATIFISASGTYPFTDIQVSGLGGNIIAP